MSGGSHSIVELTQDSPQSPHPHGLGVNLYRHQLTLLHRALELEQGKIDLSDPAHVEESVSHVLLGMMRSAGDDGECETRFETRMGVLADKVGAGKSYTILALAHSTYRQKMLEASEEGSLLRARPPDVQTTFRSLVGNRICLTNTQRISRTLPVTIVVIPHTLFNQWNEYVARFGGGMRCLAISRQKHFGDMADLDQYDVVLVTSTFHNRLAIRLFGKRVRRVVYDEADSLNIASCMQIDAAFHWFATASYSNLQYPAGSGWWGHSRMQTGVRSSGFIRQVFSELYSSHLGRQAIKPLILRNRPEFVDASIQLPEPVVHIIHCRTPISIRVLNGFVDNAVIQRLNAGDVEAAVQQINPQNRGSEANIVSVLLDKLTRNEHNLVQRVQLMSELRFESPEERDAEDARLRAQLSEVRAHMDNIRERVQQSNTCGICYEEMVVVDRSRLSKTVVPCCSNSFCFMCINRWLMQRSSCPMCKTSLAVDDLLVVDANDHERDEILLARQLQGTRVSTPPEPETAAERSGVSVSASHNKIENLEAILRGRLHNRPADEPRAKIMLFVAFDNDATVNRWLSPLLESLGIRWRFLKGNHNVTAATEREYRHGSVDMLLVNTNNYGSGLNCENTTDVIMMNKFDSDIEQQVIGRAQRIGRASPLNIWYLVFENEVARLGD